MTRNGSAPKHVNSPVRRRIVTDFYRKYSTSIAQNSAIKSSTNSQFYPTFPLWRYPTSIHLPLHQPETNDKPYTTDKFPHPLHSNHRIFYHPWRSQSMISFSACSLKLPSRPCLHHLHHKKQLHPTLHHRKV